MATLTVPFATDIIPAGGFRLFYRPKGSSVPYTQHPVNFVLSPAVIVGLVDQDYEGYLEGDSGDGNLCPQKPFETTKYSCVDIDDFNLDSSTPDEIKLLFPIILAVTPHVNQVVTVTCKDLVTDLNVGTVAVIVAPDGSKVSPAGDVKFSGLVNGRNYRITLTNNCNSAFVTSQDIVAGVGALKEWVENTVTCEQEAAFTLQNEYTNFSSPIQAFYDQPTARVYVGDLDDAAGNIYWFNPNTFGGIGTINRVSFIDDIYYNVVVDKQYRRLYFVGRNSSGLRVFNINDHTNQLVPWGINGGAFNRVNIYIINDLIYCNDNSNGTIVIIDRATLTLLNTINKSSIPSGTTYLNSFRMFPINGQLWVSAEFGLSGNIAIYDLALTTLIATVTLPGVTIESSSRFRQNAYYDEVNDKFYVGDTGSKKWFVVDGASRAVVAQGTITNDQGKTFTLPYWTYDPITNELFMGTDGYNNASDPSNTHLFRVYRQNRLTYQLEYVYPGQAFSQLTHQVGTNVLWGTFSGQPQFGGAGGWDTDGKIIKYTR